MTYRVGWVGLWICVNWAKVICAWSCKFSTILDSFNARVSTAEENGDSPESTSSTSECRSYRNGRERSLSDKRIQLDRVWVVWNDRGDRSRDDRWTCRCRSPSESDWEPWWTEAHRCRAMLNIELPREGTVRTRILPKEPTRRGWKKKKKR